MKRKMKIVIVIDEPEDRNGLMDFVVERVRDWSTIRHPEYLYAKSFRDAQVKETTADV